MDRYNNPMKNNSKYFKNNQCEYFPCHRLEGDFNCLFCYCPLYSMKNCPGNPVYKEKNGKMLKVCTNCTFPHIPENYDKIVKILIAQNKNQ